MTNQSTPTYICPKVATAPAIDGTLNDAIWQTVPPVRLVLTETGQSATKETILRMCWDDDNLYISYACEDEDVWNDYTEHDDPIYNEEVCEAFLCPTRDFTKYFEINVSPRNVVFDAIIVPPSAPTGKTDVSWTCEGLRTVVTVDGTLDCRTDTDKGWTAQMAIPFKSLDASTPTPGDQWRGNLYRIERNPLEYQAWSPTLVDPANFHVPNRFGIIIFQF